MSELSIELVTPERQVLSEDGVDVIIAPSVLGQIAVLPMHAPLIAELEPGVMVLRRGEADEVLAISGGFLEVLNDRVTVLADTSERSEEIDLERAMKARDQAMEELSGSFEAGEALRARVSLMRALARIRASERSRR